MTWKALLLVFLVLSSLAVAVGVTALRIVNLRTLRFDNQKVADLLLPPTPQQPIDDESGGG